MSNVDILDTRFRSALRRMVEQGRLRAYDGAADPELEIAAIMKKFDTEDAAILFGDVAGHDVPVIGNMLSNRANCEAAFGCDFRAIRDSSAAPSGAAASVVVERAPAHEHVHRNGFDLGAMLPVLTHTRPTAGASSPRASSSRATPKPASTRELSPAPAPRPQRTAIRLDFGRHLRLAFERAKAKGEHLPLRSASAPTSPCNTPPPPWARRCRRMPTRSRSPAGCAAGRCRWLRRRARICWCRRRPRSCWKA